MNLPNKLTVLRVILVPVFMAFFYLYDIIPYNFICALIVFGAAAITDALDGKIARKQNLVTDFGKLMDPLADKVLVAAALACFVEVGIMSAITLVISIAREFLVSGLRLVTASKGVVAPAGIWGKLKTAFTMGSIVIILFYCILAFNTKTIDADGILYTISQVLIWISTVLTVVSGIVYLKAYGKHIEGK